MDKMIDINEKYYRMCENCKFYDTICVDMVGDFPVCDYEGIYEGENEGREFIIQMNDGLIKCPIGKW